MAAARSPILLVDRGDLPSLVAGVIQGESARFVLWHLHEEDDAAPRRAEIVRRHAELFDAELIVSDAWQGGLPLDDQDAGLRQGMILLQAAIIARRTGCERIIWPIQVGPDPDRFCAVVDRATVVTDLAEIGAGDGATAGGGGRTVFDLPVADLADDQVVDLADDCGAPLELFWPCRRGESDPCGVCPGCLRWREAFRGVGLPWPWTTVPARAGM